MDAPEWRVLHGVVNSAVRALHLQGYKGFIARLVVGADTDARAARQPHRRGTGVEVTASATGTAGDAGQMAAQPVTDTEGYAPLPFTNVSRKVYDTMAFRVLFNMCRSVA